MSLATETFEADLSTPMVCEKCGNSSVDNGGFCSVCVVALLRGVDPSEVRPAPMPQVAPNWEYRDMVIPLDLKANRRVLQPIYSELMERYEKVMLREIWRLERAGWQVDGPADFSTLHHQGRIKSNVLTSWRMGREVPVGYHYESATVRMRRLVV